MAGAVRGRKRDAARSLLVRYVVANLLILLPPFVVAAAYFAVASEALSRAADAVAEVQLESSVSYVDRKLSDLEKIVSRLVVDYRVNRYLTAGAALDPVELYDTKRLSDQLSAMVLGGEFLSRCMLYLGSVDGIVYESGFADLGGFYGNLLSVEGYSADEWRALLLGGETGRLSRRSGFRVSTGGRYAPAHFLTWPIGYRDHPRGAFVAVVDAEELGRHLSRLPELYGGWMLVLDEDGALIASSNADPDPALISAAVAERDAGATTVGSERYRLYRQVSSYNGWRYVALMNEGRITASANRIRTIAFILLGTGFLVALALSYGVASSNSKPIARLFSLVLPQQELGGKRASVAYARLEEAILGLADSNKRLEREVDSIHEVARSYFFHKALRGEFRDRLLFAEDRGRFSVLVSTGPYYVVEGRLPYLAAALDGSDRLALGEAVKKAFSAALGPDEYVVDASSEAMVAIKHPASADAYREDAERFVARALENLDPAVADGLVFGVGTPVSDPFLLALSYGEAEAAVASGSRARVGGACFYDDLPAPADAYRYPLETESAVMKAVLSANTVLLDSLLEGVYADNFIERTLPMQEARYLAAALRGTVLRLAAEFERPGGDGRSAYESLTELGGADSQPQADFREAAAALTAMAEERHRNKRSHNESLAADVRSFVDERFRDHNLSLTSIADAFSLSENYLSSFFKEQSGECLSDYLQRKRMGEAAARLTESRAPLEEVAAACGYANVASFRRAFKRMYGLSPSDFRDKNRSS